MMDATRLNKLENLGYCKLPPRPEYCSGYTGLLILMWLEPAPALTEPRD